MRRALVILSSGVLLASACGGDGGDAAPGSGETAITIALEAEPSTLDPQATFDGQTRRVIENVYERLVDRDLDDPSQLVPQLAANLPERVDETTWEIEVRDGVTFTNGEPFDAAAAAASINRMIDPELDSELLDQVDTITGAEAIDDTTVRITTTGSDPVLPARLYMIHMVPPAYSQEEGFTREPIGTGPYELAEWVAGDHMELVRNDDHWDAQPAIENVTFRFLPETQSRVAALQSGEIDLAMAIPPESTADVPQAIRRDGLEYPYLRLKNYEGPFADERVRRAAALALRTTDYIDTIYQGNASPANCQMNGDGVFGYNPDLEPYPFDPDEARNLLAEAGYDGEEVRIIAPSGRWLKFEELSEAVAADLQDVGFNVNMELVPLDPWLTEFVQQIGEGQPDAALSSFANELQDGDRISGFIGRSGAASSYDDPELEAELDEARTQLDLEERNQIYQDVYAEICDEIAFIPLLTFQDVYGAAENLEWVPRFDGTARVEEMSLG